MTPLLYRFMCYFCQSWGFSSAPIWGDGSTGINNAPPDEPKCGFDGSKCSKTPRYIYWFFCDHLIVSKLFYIHPWIIIIGDSHCKSYAFFRIFFILSSSMVFICIKYMLVCDAYQSIIENVLLFLFYYSCSSGQYSLYHRGMRSWIFAHSHYRTNFCYQVCQI